METIMQVTIDPVAEKRDAFAERLLQSLSGAFDVFTIYMGDQLGFYDALAPEPHEQEVLVEPDSREPWFLRESHNVGCLYETLDKVERAVDITLSKIEEQNRAASSRE